MVANAISQAALLFVESDPQKAYDLAIKSITFGDGYQLSSVWFGLSKKEPRLAQQLFDYYLSVTERKSSSNASRAIGNLGYMIFPAVLINPSIQEKNEIHTNDRRVRYLKLLSNFAQANNERPCLYLSFIYKLLPKYQELLPSEFTFLHLLTKDCKSKTFFENSEGKALETFEDYLAEADKTEDLQQKETFQMIAAKLALEKKLFKKSIEILEAIDVSVEQKDFWQTLREDCAVYLAYELFSENKISQALKETDAVPKEIRLQTKLKLVNLIAEEGNYEKNSFYEILSDAVKENDRFTFENENNKGYGFVLVFPFARVAEKSNEFPAEAISLFQQTVKRWNKVHFYENNDDRKKEDDKLAIGVEYRVAPLNLPEYLLKSDFITTANTIEEINSLLDRVKGRLFLLKFLLNKKVALEKEIKKQQVESKNP